MTYGTKPDNDILAFFKPNGVIFRAQVVHGGVLFPQGVATGLN